jgi:hypothetical protein
MEINKLSQNKFTSVVELEREPQEPELFALTEPERIPDPVPDPDFFQILHKIENRIESQNIK